MLRPSGTGRAFEVTLEPGVSAAEAAAVVSDYKEKLSRTGAHDVSKEIEELLASPKSVKAVCRTPSGSVEGLGVLSPEGHASDVAFLHITARYATDAATASLLDTLLQSLPRGTTKVRAQVSTAGRWLHVPPGRARALLESRSFTALCRALMLRDLRRPVPPLPPTPTGYRVTSPEPAQFDAWSHFAFEAYRGTTDFAVITLEESEPAYRRLYTRFLGGEFGPYARGMSFAAVPEGAGDPAAVLHSVFVGSDPYVGDLSVAPAHRRRGLGRLLLLRALSAYAAAGATRTGLTATEQNRTAFTLYRSVGFEVARTTDVFVRYL